MLGVNQIGDGNNVGSDLFDPILAGKTEAHGENTIFDIANAISWARINMHSIWKIIDGGKVRPANQS